MEKQNYYVGLDMGTTSAGWAVSNENYQLLRAKGKDLWGVRLFDEASTSVDRRTFRVSRRRRTREKARIGLVKEYFAKEIEKVDLGFYQRLDESKYFLEDRSVQNHQQFSIFSDKNYTDKEYFSQYPTIFHLRKELIESKEPHDVRLVYLAILNMFKHRGHFLNMGLGDTSDVGGVAIAFKKFIDSLKQTDIISPKEIDTKAVEIALNKTGLSRTAKCEALMESLHLVKGKENKKIIELLKLLCGMKIKIANIYDVSLCDNEDLAKKSFSFRDGDLEDTMYLLESNLPDEIMEVIDKIKNVHDICLLGDIKKRLSIFVSS